MTNTRRRRSHRTVHPSRPNRRGSFVAKIAPPARTKGYPRERLFRLLDRARRESKVTWIAGPAGAGKTTLAATYSASREVRCLWYRADAADRDPATFFHFLGLVAARAAPRFRRPLPTLTPEYFQGARVFAHNFFRELGRRVGPPFVLILDNLQELDGDPEFHEVLLAGLRELPPGGHAFLISRTEAPAAYARLRVSRGLSEIDWQSLRLREEESRALAAHLSESSGGDRRDVDDTLHRRSEGWIAGLILLLELGSETGSRPRRRTAQSQKLFDYFAAEVFARRPPAVRDFLLLTALFPSFTASMAARLTGNARAEALLRELSRQHHFTEQRSERGDDYQYHSLFREFLLATSLGAWGPSEIARQRRRAAGILEQEERFEEALPLYLAAGDSAAAIRLIRARAEALVAVGRHATLAALIDALPAPDRERDPWLLFWRGLARSSVAPGNDARADLAAAYAMFDAIDDAAGLYATWTAIVESFFNEYRGYRPADHWIAAFESLRERHPEFPSLQVELRALWAAVGILHNRFMEHPLLPRVAGRLDELIASVDDAGTRMLLGSHSLLYYAGLGNIDRMNRLWALLRFGDLRSDAAPLVRATACVSAALVAWWFGNSRACLWYVEEGLRFVDRHGLPPVLRLLCLYQGIYGALAGGDVRAAGRFLQRFGAVATGGPPVHVAIYLHCAAMTAAHRGDLRTAQRDAAASVDAAEQSGVLQGHLINLYLHANVVLLGGDRGAGTRLLAAAYAIAAEKGSRHLQFLCRFSEGAFALDEDRRAGLSTLREALALSREMDGPAIPWLPHKVLARAYGAALAEGIETEHVTSLIQKLGVAPTDEVLHVDAWPWPIKIYTLGRFGVAVDGETLRFSSKAQKRPLELLKTLIAFGGRSVREDRIVEVLWPDVDADHSALTLTTTIHRLRKLIGQQAVERSAGRITLDARTCWVDAWSLERALATAERTCRTGSPDAIEALADNVSALYRGGFLGDQGEEPWLLTTRDRIRDKLLRVLGQAADALVHARRHEQALRCLQRSLEIEPLAEATYRRLMQAHLVREQHSEALAVYHRCRKVLAAHFGVGPSPDTEALRQRIPVS